MSANQADWTAEDRAAAAAVVGHHAQLAAGLDQRVQSLLSLAAQAEQARSVLLAYLRDEVLPHAGAEEQRLYPVAAARPAGALLVEGMLDEHRTIGALVKELESAISGVHAAAAARALSAIFSTHLTKENELIVPLLAGDPDVSLADLLAGMHELLGGGHGAEHAGEDSHGGCGCGGCGCGGEDAAAAAEPAGIQPIGVDARLDVRSIPHARRHAVVLSALESVAPGDALVLVAPHAPNPLLAQIKSYFGGQFDVQWLQSGPEVWQLRLERSGARG